MAAARLPCPKLATSRRGEREQSARAIAEPADFLQATLSFLAVWEVGGWTRPFVFLRQQKLRPGSREVKGPPSLSSSGFPRGLQASAPSAGGRARGGPGSGERERACGRSPQPRAAPRPVPPASPELAPRALPGRLAPGPPPPSRGRGRGRRAAGFPSSAGAPGSASARVPAPSAGSGGRCGGVPGSEGRRPAGRTRRRARAVSALTAEHCGGASEDGHELRRQARRARARGAARLLSQLARRLRSPQNAWSSPGPRPSPLAPRRRRPPAHPGAGWCPRARRERASGPPRQPPAAPVPASRMVRAPSAPPARAYLQPGTATDTRRGLPTLAARRPGTGWTRGAGARWVAVCFGFFFFF